jgi:hypothetical protein
MIKKTFIYASLFITSLFGWSFIYKISEEPKEVFYAFSEMSEVLKYNKVIFETANKQLMVDTIVDFMNKKSIEEVEEKISNLQYSVSDLGLPESNYCKIFVNINKETISCELKNKLKASGTLLFSKINKNEWSCDYSGSSSSKPISCKNKIEILAKN